jgi:hypothetical chaperone protein
VSEIALQKRLQQARSDENRRYNQDLEDLAALMASYDSRLKPPHPKHPIRPNPKKPESYPEGLERAFEEYEKSLITYGSELERYKIDLEHYNKLRREYEAEQRSYLRPVVSDELLRQSVSVAMQREMSEAAERRYWDQTFFSAVEKGTSFLFGREAIRAYLDDPISGFFIRSPKSFLAADLSSTYRDTFISIIEKIVGHIKNKSEAHFGEVFRGVVFGRPINYHGTRGEAGNSAALKLMKSAAIRAGFVDVRFFFEPVAAAMQIGSEKSRGIGSAIVLDIGGGTTDISLVKFTHSKAERHSFDVPKSIGSRIGGTDFDQAIAWGLYMPALGRNENLDTGLPVPNRIFHDAISTRDLPAQIRFRSSRAEIEELLRQARFTSKLKRLLTLYDSQGQHRLILDAELLKIRASVVDHLVTRLDYIESELLITTSHQDYVSSIEGPTRQILHLLDQINVGLPRTPEVIFATGGMAQSSDLVNSLRTHLRDRVRVEIMDAMSSVASGLGVVARMVQTGESLDHLESLGLASGEALS